jgi:hypothetical protein
MLPSDLETWCRQQLGAPPVRVLFETRHLSRVVGVELAGGRAVVIKARPASAERIRGCMAVQQALWTAGFPCPQPLAGPAPLGDLLATAEAWLPGGDLLARIRPTPPEWTARFAGELARLVRLAPPPAVLPSLAPAPPWVAWNHAYPGVWPPPDDSDADLNAVPDPPWIDEVGRRVRARMAGCGLPLVTGHADWESQNLRWQGADLYAVHDWDSAAAQPEAALAGAAAAVFPADGPPLSDASVAESEAFLHAYAAARGRPWSRDEWEIAWAAGLWVRVFNAKKASLRPDGAPTVALLQSEAPHRLRLAGA